MKIQTSIVENSTRRLESAYGADLLRRASAARESAQAATDTVVSPELRELVARYVRDTRTPTDVYAYERAIGTNDLLSIDYFWKGLRAARAVARIVIPPTPGIPGEMATGFLVAPNVLLTNWHVFEDNLTMAARAHAQFSYEADRDGRERQSTSFRIDPSTFFCSDKNLDYCFVALEPASREGPEALESFGWLRLNPQLGKTDYGQFLSIIQHPGGQPKQVAIRENRMLPFDDRSDFLSYQSDTLRGSSGAPVFNDYWDVVALHHSGKPLLDTEGHYLDHDNRPIIGHEPQEDEIQWVANEGARVSRIVTDCLQRAPEGAFKESLKTVIQGRLPPSEVPNEAATIAGDTSMHLPDAGARDRAVIIVPLDVDIRLGRGSAAAVTVTTQTTQPATQPRAVTTAGIDAGATLEKLNFDPDYRDRRGYDEVFLGRQRRVPLPLVDQGHTDEIAPTKQGGKQLDYHHFSVVMHKQRRVAIFSACNVDYRAVSRDERARDDFGKDQWITDDRMDSNWQIPKAFYDRWKKLDYGHLVRRDDNCWGATRDEVEFSNADTFHMTNCTPQHEAFNRDRFGYHGLWGRIENAIAEQATRDGTISRLCIFAGPIFQRNQYLTLNDPDIGQVWVPFAFWKVVACPARRGGLQVFGFIASQKTDLQADPPFEDFVADEFTSQQVSLAAIEAKTPVRFDQSLKAVDVMANRSGNDGHESLVIRDTNEIFMGSAPTIDAGARL